MVKLELGSECALLDWIPVNSRLFEVRLDGSVRVSRILLKLRCLFVLSVRGSTGCNPPEASSTESYLGYSAACFQQTFWSLLMILTSNLVTYLRRNDTSKAKFTFQPIDNVDYLIQVCSGRIFFLSSTNFCHQKQCHLIVIIVQC